MVSLRCKLAVKTELENLGLYGAEIFLGKIEIHENLTAGQIEKLRIALLKSGLELIKDSKSILIEKVKITVIEMVHFTDDLPKINFSDYVSRKLNRDYTYLANIFSEVTGNTIEHFIIAHKIERVKELLMYDELNITEIADKLHYSSVAHLSNQFRKVTGLTPTSYKNLKGGNRSELENV